MVGRVCIMPMHGSRSLAYWALSLIALLLNAVVAATLSVLTIIIGRAMEAERLERGPAILASVLVAVCIGIFLFGDDSFGVKL